MYDLIKSRTHLQYPSPVHTDLSVIYLIYFTPQLPACILLLHSPSPDSYQPYFPSKQRREEGT